MYNDIIEFPHAVSVKTFAARFKSTYTSITCNYQILKHGKGSIQKNFNMSNFSIL